MAEAAAGVAAVSSLAGVGLSAYGQYQQAKGTQAADEYQSARLQRAAEYGRLTAEQTEGQLTERLNRTLGMIDVTRAAANTDPTSPTGAAVSAEVARQGTRQRNIQVENILAQSQQDESDAAYLRQAGAFALTQGKIAAFATLLKGIGGAGGSAGFGLPSAGGGIGGGTGFSMTGTGGLY